MRVTRAVLPLLAFSAERGVPPPALLGAAALDPLRFASPDIDLGHDEELRLWSEAARLTADDDFGLHFAEWLAPRTDQVFDVLAFALRSCATLGDHYRRASRYVALVHAGVSCWVEEEGDLARLVHAHPLGRDEARHPAEGFLALSLLLGRLETGESLTAREVRFSHAGPSDTREHERIFGASVRFGCPRDELWIDRAHLARPQRRAEPRLLEMLNRQLEEQLERQPAHGRFLEQIKRHMMDELPDREPSIASVASKQRMSPRTLQRRLQEEGATFAGLLSDLRRELALRYLRDSRIAIAEVGFLLGFQDVTAFHRAFKRWTGSTPAQFRRAS